MAKGGLLKTQLKNLKDKEAAEAAKVKPSKEKKGTKTQAQPVIPEVKEPVVEKKEPVVQKKAKKQDEYQSDVLSKKEQRKLKKLQREAEEAEEEEGESEESDEELDFDKLAASESESDINGEDNDDSDSEDEDEDEEEEVEQQDDDDDEEEEEAEDIPLSDVELDSDADVVPHTKLTINNTAALKDSLARIELPWAKHSFIEHYSVTSADKTEAEIKDIYDDTERELAFYKQGLDAVKQARSTLVKLKVPFSRPVDYFAEMVKSDEHMDKLKTKLLKEAADKKASQDAKKQRSLKKFGKQVQHATLQERAKQKKDTLEKIKSLKKRGASEMNGEDDFDIALEEATRDDRRDNKRNKPNGKRLAKNSKYGFGGMKRGKRENDAKSSADISGFSSKKMKGKTARPGKSKRSRRN